MNERDTDQSRHRLHKLIMQIITNQLRLKNPPETKETLDRLMSEGYSQEEARELIGAVISAHIYDMLKDEHTFDNTKYVADLKRLPKVPWEE